MARVTPNTRYKVTNPDGYNTIIGAAIPTVDEIHVREITEDTIFEIHELNVHAGEGVYSTATRDALDRCIVSGYITPA